jgi:hypothetical protein
MRVTISIATRLLGPLADALAGRYGYTAEYLHEFSLNVPPARVRERDPDLFETLGMIDQTYAERSEIARNDRVIEVAVTGERELLSAAVYDLLQHTVAALNEACERFPTGPDDVPDLEEACRRVGDVLRVLRETELVSVQHPDRPG